MFQIEQDKLSKELLPLVFIQWFGGPSLAIGFEAHRGEQDVGGHRGFGASANDFRQATCRSHGAVEVCQQPVGEDRNSIRFGPHDFTGNGGESPIAALFTLGLPPGSFPLCVAP